MRASDSGPDRLTLRSLVKAFVPEAGQLQEDAWRECETMIRRALELRPASVRRQVRLLVRSLDLLCLVRTGRRLTAAEPARIGSVLESLQDSRILLVRRGIWGLRTLAFFGYYGREEAGREIGYGASPDGWRGRREAGGGE